MKRVSVLFYRAQAAALFLALAGMAGAEELKEIFYVPFDDSPNAVAARGSAKGSGAAPKEAGVVGKAGAANFDARGNVDLDRGTLAFFLKLPKAPAEMDWDGYVMVGGLGYWGFIMAPLMVVPEHFCMQFFNIGLYTQRLDWPYLAKTWKANEWHHVAMVWDRNEGITVYEDGKRIGSNWGSYSWEWNLTPAALTMNHGLMDEVRVYSAPLTDAQIAQLAKHEKPTGDPIPITTEAKRREKDLARMGWLEAELKELPVVTAGQPQEFSFARIVKCADSKRDYAEPFDGLKASPWPHQIYGHSARGRFAELDLASNPKYDRVTLFVQRDFRGELQELIPGVGYQPIQTVNARAGTFWRASLGAMRAKPRLAITREAGRLGEMQFYRVEPLKLAAPKAPLFFNKLDRMPDSDAGLALLAETASRFDNPVRAVTVPTATWKLAAPAFGGFQALTEAKADPLAADGALITLVAEGITKPTPVQITVKEPVWFARDWLVADALLKPNGAGRQVFTLRLRGRPVVSMPATEFAMALTAGEPVTWIMGQDGCSLNLCAVPMEQALPVATEDQVEFARCGHYNVNEGHQFGDPIFDRPFRWLCAFAPDRPETREMVFLRGLPEGVTAKVSAPVFDVPKNDIDAPEWAFWQRQAMNVNRRITHWWIDHWQTPNGEFGGLWGDDTDFVENWIGLAMCADEDGKIKNSLRRIWNGLWTDCLDQGVSRYTMDDCHSYEEGMGTIAQQMLVDYGDPVAVEHTMAASSHYDKWLRKLDDGTYRWKSAYFGVNGCWDYGAFANDSNGGMLVLIPANYLIWYNRNPDVAKYFRGLKGLADGAGIGADSYHLLTADAQALAGVYAKRVLEPKHARYFQAINGMVGVSGVTDEIRKQFAPAEYKPLPPFDKYSFGAQFDDARNWLYYQTSGDIRYLVDTYKRTVEFVNSEWWLYTAADPSRDRIPLPDNSVVIARMGALPTQRGAQGTYLPWHGLSYEKGGDEVAALVTMNTDKELKARFYAFPDKPLALTTRVWRLLPGTYKVTLSKDANDDGQPEEVILTKEATLDRGAYLELILPARQPVALSVTAIKTAPPNFDRPDPAISSSDVKLVYHEHLTVPIHNLGTKPVENLLVRVRDGRSGKVIGEKRIPRIDPPVGLKPSKNGVEFLNFNALADGRLIVEIDPDREIDDLNRYNNRVECPY